MPDYNLAGAVCLEGYHSPGSNFRLACNPTKIVLLSEVLELRRIGLTNREALLANWVDEAHEKQSVANIRN